ncbi:S-adenosyl-L-methionine-dependent methyltransferase [Auricularia subglabra TFB-10046 SS5]|nr:S-adenosyl-L-methionine-dependent methyltransferase [Auricularia subglabra TFB-10046 SS5]
MAKQSDEQYAGRTFKDSNRIYRLPGDQAELERLSLQHQLLRGILGALYPCDSDVAHAVLAPPREPDGQRPQVLDIGSGSGLWAMQMAMEFPHANVVGLDINLSKPAHVPTNCVFETGDITHGLSRYYGQFDFVHCRCMAGAVRDYAVLLREIWKCLRPGGICVMGEGDLRVYNEEKVLAPIRLDNDNDPTHSWLARLLFEVLQLNSRRSASSIGWQLERFLSEDGGFEDIQYKRRYAPIGWAGDGSLGDEAPLVGRLMKQNCYDFVRAWRPLLLMNSFAAEQVDSWIRAIDHELHNPTVLKQYNVWHYAWAFKKKDEPQRWEDRPWEGDEPQWHTSDNRLPGRSEEPRRPIEPPPPPKWQDDRYRQEERQRREDRERYEDRQRQEELRRQQERQRHEDRQAREEAQWRDERQRRDERQYGRQ